MSTNQRPVMIEPMERRLHLDATQLTDSITASTLAASVSDESVTKGTVTVGVANDTAVAQKFKAKVEILAGVKVLASKSESISLLADADTAFTVPVVVGKGKLADGTYGLTAEVLESGGLFSQSAVGASVVVRPPIVDLSETETFRKLVTTVSPYTKFATTDIVSITNSGSDPSVDPMVVTVYASTDDAIAGAVKLLALKKRITIKAGQTVSVPIGVRVNAGLPAGTYQLITAVTQTNATVTTTNPATAPVLDVPGPITVPEFVETILTVTPVYTNQSSGAQALSQIDVQMAIENKGAGTGGSSQYALYVSTSPTFDSSATLVATEPLTQSIPGGDHDTPFQIDFGIPTPSPVAFDGAAYYVFIKVTDPDGGVSMGSDATPVVIN